MKLVKKFVLAVLFVSALSVRTFAGDMETPGYAPPPPPPEHSMTSTATTDDCTQVSSDVASQTGEVSTISDTLLYEAYMALLGLF
jgi:hypothetical protein